MKPERIQGPMAPVDPERLQALNTRIGNWELDPTPSAISRQFPQPSFQASAAFLTKVAAQAEKKGRSPYAFVDATGVTVRLGNAPVVVAFAPLRGDVGVTEADLDLAAALTAIS